MTGVERRIIGRVAIGAGVLALLALYFIFDPGRSALAPKCMFHAVTGWDCAGCGSQRMLHALLHGDLAGAWRANAFLLCVAPLVAVMAWAAMFRERWPRLYSRVNSLPVIIRMGAGILVWTVARNLV